jgi:cation diffusion facilitator family transporter
MGDARHHDHDHQQHAPSSGIGHRLRHSLQALVVPHTHDSANSVDDALEGNWQGVRAVRVSFAVLLVTAGLQALVVALSGSVALFSDALHNGADALTAVPLWLAFRLGNRPPNRRFTYGFGKVEDVAGLVIVLVVAASAGVAIYSATERLIHPEKVTHLAIVVVAGFLGVLGNEVVAQYRTRVGRRIGSAALEADGEHARADGIASFLVVIGALGVACGFDWADPAVGLLIAAVILLILVRTSVSIGQRILDAVDPNVIEQITRAVAAVDGVEEVSEVQARWIGHRLFAQVRLSVDGSLSITEAHGVAEVSLHRLLHDVPKMSDAIVHVDPAGSTTDAHRLTAHHRSGGN